MTRLQNVILPLLPLLLLFVAAEFLVGRGFIADYILPTPSSVLQSFIESKDEYLAALAQTFKASSVGLVGSILAGVLLALMFSFSRFVEKAFFPYAVFFQTVPVISIAPLLVIWFGFGLPTVIASSFIVSIFPIIANTLAGLQRVPQPLNDLFRLYGASRMQILFKLNLPSAVPQILTGIRVATGLALVGAIVGEFVAGGGLGGLIDIARTQQRLDKVFASVLLASFLGIGMVGIINLISRSVFYRWRELFKESL